MILSVLPKPAENFRKSWILFFWRWKSNFCFGRSLANVFKWWLVKYRRDLRFFSTRTMVRKTSLISSLDQLVHTFWQESLRNGLKSIKIHWFPRNCFIFERSQLRDDWTVLNVETFVEKGSRRSRDLRGRHSARIYVTQLEIARENEFFRFWPIPRCAPA